MIFRSVTEKCATKNFAELIIFDPKDVLGVGPLSLCDRPTPIPHPGDVMGPVMGPCLLEGDSLRQVTCKKLARFFGGKPPKVGKFHRICSR